MQPPSALFVSDLAPFLASGGGLVSRRNERFLKDSGVFREVFDFRITPRPVPRVLRPFRWALALILGLAEALTILQIVELLRQIRRKNIGLVFIDSSKFGVLSFWIKMFTSAKVVVFFHNNEESVYRQIHGTSIRHRLKNGILRHNQKTALRYADHMFFISAYDRQELLTSFERSSILPVTFPPSISAPRRLRRRRRPLILLVGSDYPPNIEGFRWFLENVFDSRKMSAVIAGYGLDKYRSEFRRRGVRTIANYPDISKLYLRASAVAAPIFQGSGLKVKVADALRHGTPLTATSKAFEGYETPPANAPIFIQDEPSQFQAALLAAAQASDDAQDRVRAYFETHYDETSFLRAFTQALTEVLLNAGCRK